MDTDQEPAEEPKETPATPPEDKPTQTFDQSTTTSIHTAVIEYAAFGGAHNTQRARLTPATGSVQQDDLDALRYFVEPEGFTGAVERLARDKVVILCGAMGIGKRSSALALLRAVTDEVLYRLSPQGPLAEMAKQEYKENCGYLVIDRVADGNVIESDFEWRLVRDRLADQKAYLVVTTAAQVSVMESVVHFPWYLPNAEHVLRVRWPAKWPEEHEKTLCDTLESSERVVDVVELANRLNNGESPDIAVTHFDSKLREQVADWFETKPDRRKILEVATLAFTPGVDERHFESALALLRNALEKHMPQEGDQAATEEAGMPQARENLAENKLVTTVVVASELGTRGALIFAVPDYHQHVLAELWRRMDVRFWDAIRDWLDVVVLRSQYEQRLAIGLAELAAVALDEVLPTLDRWARGQHGTAGQRATVYTLWFMAYYDALAPTALQIATRWITRGEPTHRWVAAMTFSGQLGVRYPHEAINVLWQLCVHAHVVDGDVYLVFGQLFGTLVQQSTKDAGIVLTALEGKVRRFTKLDARPRMASVTARTTLAALSAADPGSNRVAVLVYLAEFPERTQQVAALLAKTLVHRPIRLRAIGVLRTILEDLAKNEDSPEARARDLGNALAAQLPDGEREALENDFRTFATRKNKNIAQLITVLLDALSAMGR